MMCSFYERCVRMDETSEVCRLIGAFTAKDAQFVKRQVTFKVIDVRLNVDEVQLQPVMVQVFIVNVRL